MGQRPSYDTAGDLVSVSLPGIATPVTYVYDATHLLTEEVDPQGNSASATYDAEGRLQSRTGAVGHVTSFSYDVSGRVTTITNPDGRLVACHEQRV